VRAGKARYIGASSMYAWQFAKALHASERNGWARFVSMQNHYNLVYREEEREMIPLCRDQGVGLIPWSPLARGFLAGNRTREKSGETLRARTDEFAQQLYYQPDDFKVAERVQEIAREHARKPTQVALAWLLSRPAMTAPIIGASKMEHLDDAVAALGVKLGDDDVKRLEEPYSLIPCLGIHRLGSGSRRWNCRHVIREISGPRCRSSRRILFEAPRLLAPAAVRAEYGDHDARRSDALAGRPGGVGRAAHAGRPQARAGRLESIRPRGGRPRRARRPAEAPGRQLPQRHRHRTGGQQILCEDPSGNAIELFQPA